MVSRQSKVYKSTTRQNIPKFTRLLYGVFGDLQNTRRLFNFQTLYKLQSGLVRSKKITSQYHSFLVLLFQTYYMPLPTMSTKKAESSTFEVLGEFHFDLDNLSLSKNSIQTNDANDGTTNEYEQLEGKKERTRSFPISSPCCVTYVRKVKKSQTQTGIDGATQYPKRIKRRIIAIESSV